MFLSEKVITTTLMLMAKKKTPKDRHKPRRMVGVPERICQVFEQMAAESEATLSEMVKNACLFFLESKGRWPPPSSPPPSR